jgi:hypothetical protein
MWLSPTELYDSLPSSVSQENSIQIAAMYCLMVAAEPGAQLLFEGESNAIVVWVSLNKPRRVECTSV